MTIDNHTEFLHLYNMMRDRRELLEKRLVDSNGVYNTKDNMRGSETELKIVNTWLECIAER